MAVTVSMKIMVTHLGPPSTHIIQSCIVARLVMVWAVNSYSLGNNLIGDNTAGVRKCISQSELYIKYKLIYYINIYSTSQ